MNKSINIDRRGTLTLPVAMRRRLSLPKEGGILIAQETPAGILLRAGQIVPAELYTEEEIAGYRRADEELRVMLPNLKKSAPKRAKQ